MVKEKIWSRDFIVVCLSSFFMFLTFYILATAFPLYVRDSMHGDQQQMGLAITIYVVGGVLGRPFSGMWVDRFGKKKMAVIGMIIFLLACISYFGAKGMALFLIVRLLHGISYAVASTATSTAATVIIPTSRQGEGIGYYSMFMSIAMAIGPALGLLLWKDHNVNVLLTGVCVIAAASLLFTLGIRLPGQKKERDEAAVVVPQPEPVVEQKRGWSKFIEPKAVPISLVGFILSFAYSSLSGFFASFAEEIHQTQITALFFVVFAVMIVVSRPIVGKVFDNYKEHYLYYPGIVLFIVGMLVLSAAHSGFMVLFAGMVLGVGYGALLPCFQTLAIKLSPAHRRGSATGTFFLLFDLGYGFGSYFMGMIASFTDYRVMYEGAGVVALLSAVSYYILHHRRQAKRSALPRQAGVA
ncbi:MFS transporter [Paenibacillus cellulosilyticus]|uniref:MFS transporter n=1 Tax=Paenibacillus cellulosilyticus TaxID=375489 RepID=UPI001580C725|nr:MFS transporter [Paenibacillus cellulosilyticus]